MASLSHQRYFHFQPLRNINFAGFETSEVQELLEKWSMKDGLSLQGFSFSPTYKEYLQSEFVMDFFTDASVMNSFKVKSSNVLWNTFGFRPNGVTQSHVPCSLTTTSVFDKLKLNEAIVRENGSLVKCFPYFIRPQKRNQVAGDESTLHEEPEIEVGNLLQKLIIKQNSNCNADVEDKREKGCGDSTEEELGESGEEKVCVNLMKEESDEFLFKIFSHLVIGGSLCQYEDSVLPYIQVATKIYKDLISVSLEPNKSSSSLEKRISVKSHVVKVHSVQSRPELPPHEPLDSLTNLVFYKPRFNNFLYLIIDPDKSLVFTFYHQV